MQASNSRASQEALNQASQRPKLGKSAFSYVGRCRAYVSCFPQFEKKVERSCLLILSIKQRIVPLSSERAPWKERKASHRVATHQFRGHSSQARKKEGVLEGKVNFEGPEPILRVVDSVFPEIAILETRDDGEAALRPDQSARGLRRCVRLKATLSCLFYSPLVEFQSRLAMNQIFE